MIDRELVPFIADLLMGAAYADDRLRGKEVIAIKEKLAGLLEVGRIPASLERRLATFDPDRFDMDLVVSSMPKLEPEVARHVLEMIAEIHAADGELDLDEDHYLQSLARAFGLPRRAWADLSLDFETDESDGTKPPPVPEGA